MEFPATFWENVTPGATDDECWLWSGTVSADGYGRFSVSADGGKQRRRAAQVTGKENTLRGDTFQARNAAKTHCPQGHPYSGENLRSYNGTRYCLACKREATRRYRAAHN